MRWLCFDLSLDWGKKTVFVQLTAQILSERIQFTGIYRLLNAKVKQHGLTLLGGCEVFASDFFFFFFLRFFPRTNQKILSNSSDFNQSDTCFNKTSFLIYSICIYVPGNGPSSMLCRIFSILTDFAVSRCLFVFLLVSHPAHSSHPLTCFATSAHIRCSAELLTLNTLSQGDIPVAQKTNYSNTPPNC